MKEVTIQVGDDAYENFKAEAEDCNMSVEDFIADIVWDFYEFEF